MPALISDIVSVARHAREMSRVSVGKEGIAEVDLIVALGGEFFRAALAEAKAAVPA